MSPAADPPAAPYRGETVAFEDSFAIPASGAHQHQLRASAALWVPKGFERLAGVLLSNAAKTPLDLGAAHRLDSPGAVGLEVLRPEHWPREHWTARMKALLDGGFLPADRPAIRFDAVADGDCGWYLAAALAGYPSSPYTRGRTALHCHPDHLRAVRDAIRQPRPAAAVPPVALPVVTGPAAPGTPAAPPAASGSAAPGTPAAPPVAPGSVAPGPTAPGTPAAPPVAPRPPPAIDNRLDSDLFDAFGAVVVVSLPVGVSLRLTLVSQGDAADAVLGAVRFFGVQPGSEADLCVVLLHCHAPDHWQMLVSKPRVALARPFRPLPGDPQIGCSGVGPPFDGAATVPAGSTMVVLAKMASPALWFPAVVRRAGGKDGLQCCFILIREPGAVPAAPVTVTRPAVDTRLMHCPEMLTWAATRQPGLQRLSPAARTEHEEACRQAHLLMHSTPAEGLWPHPTSTLAPVPATGGTRGGGRPVAPPASLPREGDPFRPFADLHVGEVLRLSSAKGLRFSGKLHAEGRQEFMDGWAFCMEAAVAGLERAFDRTLPAPARAAALREGRAAFFAAHLTSRMLCSSPPMRNGERTRRYRQQRFALLRERDFAKLLDDYVRCVASVPAGEPPEFRAKDPVGHATARAKRSFAAGNVGGALRQLGSGGLAQVDNLVEALQALHPNAERPPPDPEIPAMAREAARQAFKVLDEDVRQAALRIRPGTAGGPSGLCGDMLRPLSARFGRHATVARHARSALASLFSMIAQGGLPADLWPLLSGGLLIPLSKPSGGLRPIAMGEALSRLLGSVLTRKCTAKALTLLAPLNFAVGVRGGCEQLFRGISIATDNASAAAAVLSLDFENAFNSMSRAHLYVCLSQHGWPELLPYFLTFYASPASLEVVGVPGRATIMSRQGVRQGDPMGMLLFCIGLRPLLMDILAAAASPPPLLLSYADDASVAGEPASLQQALQTAIRLTEDPRNPTCLRLCMRKCKLLLRSPAAEQAFARTDGRLWPKELLVLRCSLQRTLRLAGGYLGPPEACIAEVIRDLNAELGPLLERIASLDHAHMELTLLRVCVAMKATYLLRILPYHVGLAFAQCFDGHMRAALCRLMGLQPAELDEDAAARAMAPIRFGGVGVVATAPRVAHCVLASSALLLDKGFSQLLRIPAISVTLRAIVSSDLSAPTSEAATPSWGQDLYQAWTSWQDALKFTVTTGDAPGVRSVEVHKDMPTELCKLGECPEHAQRLFSEPCHVASLMKLLLKLHGDARGNGAHAASGAALLASTRATYGLSCIPTSPAMLLDNKTCRLLLRRRLGLPYPVLDALVARARLGGGLPMPCKARCNTVDNAGPCGGRIFAGVCGAEHILKCPRGSCSPVWKHNRMNSAVAFMLRDAGYNIVVEPRLGVGQRRADIRICAPRGLGFDDEWLDLQLRSCMSAPDVISASVAECFARLTPNQLYDSVRLTLPLGHLAEGERSKTASYALAKKSVTPLVMDFFGAMGPAFAELIGRASIRAEEFVAKSRRQFAKHWTAMLELELHRVVAEAFYRNVEHQLDHEGRPPTALTARLPVAWRGVEYRCPWLDCDPLPDPLASLPHDAPPDE